MKLNSQQLSSHLSEGPSGLYLLSGDEPLLVAESLDRIRASARDHGFDERESHVAERGFDWDEFESGLNNFSLFAARRLIEVRLPTGKPGDKGSRKLVALAGADLPDIVLVVVTPRLDSAASRSKWVKTLSTEGAWIDHRPPDRAQLPRWLAGRMAQAGLKCAPDALDFLCGRIEGNLLAAKQEIDKLVLLAEGGTVTLEVMRSSVSDGARYDVFALSDAALAGDVRRVVQVLLGLEREGIAAPLVLWSLVREITAVVDLAHRVSTGTAPGKAMADAGVWRSRQDLIGRALRRFDLAAARRLLDQAGEADRLVKGAGSGRAWSILMDLALALARGPDPKARAA